MTDSPSAADLAALGVRLDKQAAAIKRLRADRDALAARVAALESASPGTEQSAPVQVATVPVGETVGRRGVYVPNPLCLVCGNTKSPGRKELTCKPCGSERNRIIREKLPRSSYLECANCGEAKGGGMQLLCSPCSRSYKHYMSN